MGIVEPGMEAMLDVFVHETDTMLEELDEVLIVSEKAHNIDDDNINTIFIFFLHVVTSKTVLINYTISHIYFPDSTELKPQRSLVNFFHFSVVHRLKFPFNFFHIKMTIQMVQFMTNGSCQQLSSF